MTTDSKGKTLGQAIDEVIAALRDLDETTRSVVMKAACEQLKIPIASGSLVEANRSGGGQMGAGLGASGSQQGSPTLLDIRTLKERKQPATAQEMACVVAYYLQSVAPQNERKDAIGSAELDKYFRQADYPLPRRIEQLLVDARAAGYFDSAARGTYRLNAVGHNLVAHTLPRQATPARLAARSPRRSREMQPRRKAVRRRSK